jgi:hypothetical protein
MTEEEFYQKIPTWIGADRSTWNHITLFSYFCFKYEKKTGVRFKMVRSKAGPTSTKETRDFAKIIKIFCPDNIESLSEHEKVEKKLFAINKAYNYINWMFDYKFRSAPAVSGSQVFLIPSMLNEFERMYASHLKAKKSEGGISSLLDWIKASFPEALDRFELGTKDDLAIFVKYAQSKKAPDHVTTSIFEKIKEMNLI